MEKGTNMSPDQYDKILMALTVLNEHVSRGWKHNAETRKVYGDALDELRRIKS